MLDRWKVVECMWLVEVGGAKEESERFVKKKQRKEEADRVVKEKTDKVEAERVAKSKGDNEEVEVERHDISAR